jgi:hypothetical protein
MNILLGDFNAKVGREDIFKLTIGNESLHEISNNNEVRVVNFATSKNLIVKSTMFLHRNINTFENVSQFKYLGMTVTNQNLIQEEIRKRLNSGNACYNSVQNLLSSRLLSKNVKVRIYNTIILRVVLYGCETWSLPVREEQKLRLFENRVLRRICG